MLKKVILLCFSILMSVALITNCGKDDEDSATPTGPTTQELSLATEIQPIFTASCATSMCHKGAGASAGLNLEQGQAHANLVGVPSQQDASKQRVKAGDAANSYLIIKIEGRQTVGNRMPPSRALSSDQIAAIKKWIDQGAKNN